MFSFKVKFLRTKMLLWVFFASIVPYVIGGAYLGQVIMERTEAEYIQHAREVTSNIQRNLDYGFLGPVENLVSTLAQDERIMDISEDSLTNYTQFDGSTLLRHDEQTEKTLNRYFATIKKNHRNIGNIFVGSAWGGYMEDLEFTPKSAYDPRVRSWYQSTMEHPGEVVTTDPYLTSVSDQMVISITHTVERNKENVGVVGIMLYLTEFQKMVEDTKIGKTGYLMVLTPTNKFIVSPKHPEWLLKNLEEVNNESLTALVGNVNTMKTYEIDQKDQIAITNLPDKRGWKYIVVVDRGEITAQAQVVRNIIIGVYCITLLLVLLAITYASTRITRPLRKLTDVTGQMADGNLEIIDFSVGTNDELGQLAKAFSTMAKNLKESYTDLELKIEERTLELMERRKAEAALAASEEKFSKAFRCSSDAIGIVAMSDGRYREVSDAFVSILGYSREDVIGKTSGEFNLWVTEKVKFYALHQCREKGSIREIEAYWRTKTGEIRCGALSMEELQIGGERYTLFVWHDITVRKQAEEELREARNHLEAKVEERTQELNAANQELQVTNEELLDTLDRLQKAQDEIVKTSKMAALGGLVAGVAHEINTPAGVALTAASHLETITKEILDMYENKNLKRKDFEGYVKECQQATEIIFSNLKRADRLIRSFKQVSVDQTSEVRRQFNIKNYIEETLLSLSSKLKNTEHVVEVSCDESLEIDSFPGGFSQIITNLLMNALIHGYRANNAGHITITATKEENNLVLRFSDDGKGMEEEVRKKIFDPFFTTRRDAGGSGLGLHIVYNIVTQQFNGTIECESKLLKGTTFIITIPMEIK